MHRCLYKNTACGKCKEYGCWLFILYIPSVHTHITRHTLHTAQLTHRTHASPVSYSITRTLHRTIRACLLLAVCYFVQRLNGLMALSLNGHLVGLVGSVGLVGLVVLRFQTRLRELALLLVRIHALVRPAAAGFHVRAELLFVSLACCRNAHPASVTIESRCVTTTTCEVRCAHHNL